MTVLCQSFFPIGISSAEYVVGSLQLLKALKLIRETNLYVVIFQHGLLAGQVPDRLP